MRMIRYNPRPGERLEYVDGTPFPVASVLCPCCGYKTPAQSGANEICAVCFREDDGQTDEVADVVRGGPNGDLSLTAASENFRQIGACEASMLPNVRKPYEDEKEAAC